MNTPVTTDETQSQPVEPLVLRPPIFSSIRTPVEGYDGGFGVGAVEGGLRFVINPWGIMTAGDEVRVYWGNIIDDVWSHTLLAGEENKPLHGRIPSGHVVRGDVHPLFYSVKRLNQAWENSTPELKVLVKLDRPGGFDDDYNQDGHSHLLYSIPQAIIDHGIGPVEAEAGVKVTILPYPFMRENDVIHLIFGSKRLTERVTREHVEDPVKHPLIVNIDEASIVEVGDGTRISVHYQVIDEVGNYPDERSPWSAPTYLLVDLKQNRLSAPIVLEADPVTGEIKLETLGEKDVTVLVNTSEDHFRAGDIVVMTWTGTPSEGSQVVHGPIELPVVRVGLQVVFPIPNAKVKAIAMGSALVAYTLKREGVPDRPSKNASASVKGEISNLQAPQVLEASGGHLPADAPRATVAVLYYQGRRKGDLITVHWEGKRPGGGDTYYPIRIIVADEPEGTAIVREVPAKEILLLDGGSVKVWYSVANDDVMLNSVRNSLPLNLTVGDALPDLQKPEVAQADDNDVLPPENAPNGADVTAPFVDTVKDDIVGLRWVGSISGPHPKYEIPLSTHTAGYPVPFHVHLAHIEANRNGQVDVSYYVIFASGEPTRYSQVRTLSIGEPQPQWDAPSVLEAPGGQLDPNVHQEGFTVRVDTTALQQDDGIDLIIEGRAGEGSARPERRYVTGTTPIDFPIAALITAANLGREVSVRYEVIRDSGPTPSKTLPLRIGLLQNLPMPQLEGIEGDAFDPASIRDTTRVLCNQWSFQLYGAPVWVSYIEQLSDGTTRQSIPPAGIPNNQSDGLAMAAEVQWLRECKEGSTLRVELKVGLFKAATLADAVACPVRVYAVKTLFDDLTTFTGSERNGWRDNYPEEYPSRIFEEGGEYFLEYGGVFNTLYITKGFVGLAVGQTFEISFDYLVSDSAIIRIVRPEYPVYSRAVDPTGSWAGFKFEYVNNAPSPSITIKIEQGYPKLDNIRIRQVS
ncbi:hypothetical protein ABIA54_000254 [Pseudomonas sp. EB276 TE3739]|uniref:hypothetical protein n=1 Tax=Pseudomonas TaxID=286 RepID=UPI00209F15C5|nr:hypothetical protein [Pseudomonas koreensis]MCP1475653.1 hypothetical protein [Pseudomonas koreensis]